MKAGISFLSGLVVCSMTVLAQQSPAARIADLKSADGTVFKGTYFAAAKPGPGVIPYH